MKNSKFWNLLVVLATITALLTFFFHDLPDWLNKFNVEGNQVIEKTQSIMLIALKIILSLIIGFVIWTLGKTVQKVNILQNETQLLANYFDLSTAFSKHIYLRIILNTYPNLTSEKDIKNKRNEVLARDVEAFKKTAKNHFPNMDEKRLNTLIEQFLNKNISA